MCASRINTQPSLDPAVPLLLAEQQGVINDDVAAKTGNFDPSKSRKLDVNWNICRVAASLSSLSSRLLRLADGLPVGSKLVMAWMALRRFLSSLLLFASSGSAMLDDGVGASCGEDGVWDGRNWP